MIPEHQLTLQEANKEQSTEDLGTKGKNLNFALWTVMQCQQGQACCPTTQAGFIYVAFLKLIIKA